MKKKWAVTLLFCILCFSVFTACSKGAEAGLTAVDNKLTINGDTVTGRVANAVDEIKLSDYLTASKGYELKIYEDEAMANEAADKNKIKLETGDNTYYLKLLPSGKGSAKNYKLQIYRNKMFAVRFFANEGDIDAYENSEAEEGSTAIAPANPVRPGYDFNGWDPMVESTVINEETDFIAKWISKTEIVLKSGTGAILALGRGEIIYNKAYTRGSDVITFTAPAGVKHLMIKVDDYVGSPTSAGQTVTYGESLVFVLDGKVNFTIPALSDPYPYDARAFEGNSHKITARAATKSEISKYRNVALNPLDQRPDTNSFPHAIASSTNPNRAICEPRNAIDGFTSNGGSGEFPYQAWQGSAKPATEFSVLFGRSVSIDKILLTLSSNSKTYWSSAVLEFSDGSELPVTLENTTAQQIFTFPKKIASWVRLKNIGHSSADYFALSEMEVYGYDVDQEEETLPTREALVNMITKVNDNYILRNLNLGDNGWQNSVYWTGLIEAYYATGDENYYQHGIKWAEKYNWSIYGSNNPNPDNYHCFATYLDLLNIDPSYESKFAGSKKIIDQITNDEYVNNVNQGALTYWGWDDLLYMGMQVFSKMFLRTGDIKYLDKMSDFYHYQTDTLGLFDAESGLWWRDSKYIYQKGSSGVSPNGKKVFWSRGNAWVFAGLAKILQDLPDDYKYTAEYKTMFQTMAAALIDCQGSDGFWRENLADPDHVPGPETSGTAFFLYGLAWGINNGLLEKDVYLPPLIKGFNGMNANAIHPDGFIGRVQPAGEAPTTQSISYSVTENYPVGMTIHMLSELSKLSGGVDGDIQPLLNKKMVSAVAVKVGSANAVSGNKVGPLVTSDSSLKTIEKSGEVYVPVAFITEKFGKTPTSGIIDESGKDYVPLTGAASFIGRKLFRQGDLIVISYKAQLFLPESEQKLIDLLDVTLTNGKYPDRPTNRETGLFDYGDNDPVVTGWPKKVDGIDRYYSSKSVQTLAFKPKDDGNTAIVEFNVTPTRSTVDGVVGLSASTQSSNALTSLPIIVRMYATGGSWEAYNGSGYVRTRLHYTKGTTYTVRIVADLKNRKYDAFVKDPYGEEIQIAAGYTFRGSNTAANIGKIHLNDGSWGAAGGIYMDSLKVGGTAFEPN